MKPAPFVHHAPTSLEEAVSVLAEVGHDGKVLAGGQSLIPLLSMRLTCPVNLVDINRLPGLDTIEEDDGAITVGALTRHSALERHGGTGAVQPLLRETLRHVAHPAIRNRGTVVGSIAHADPAAELPAVLALTRGAVTVVGARGRREVAAADFFTGPLETVLAPDELAVSVRFGALPTGTGTAFEEAARRHGDYAVAGVAVTVEVRGGVVRSAQASFVSVSETPDVLDLTGSLAGHPADSLDAGEIAADVADPVRAHVTPETDIHASAEYRRALVVELTGRALARAAGRAVDTETRGGAR